MSCVDCDCLAEYEKDLKLHEEANRQKTALIADLEGRLIHEAEAKLAAISALVSRAA